MSEPTSQVQVLQAGVSGVPDPTEDGLLLTRRGATIEDAVLQLQDNRGEQPGVDVGETTLDGEFLQLDWETVPDELQDEVQV